MISGRAAPRDDRVGQSKEHFLCQVFRIFFFLTVLHWGRLFFHHSKERKGPLVARSNGKCSALSSEEGCYSTSCHVKVVSHQIWKHFISQIACVQNIFGFKWICAFCHGVHGDFCPPHQVSLGAVCDQMTLFHVGKTEKNTSLTKLRIQTY